MPPSAAKGAEKSVPCRTGMGLSPNQPRALRRSGARSRGVRDQRCCDERPGRAGGNRIVAQSTARRAARSPRPAAAGRAAAGGPVEIGLSPNRPRSGSPLVCGMILPPNIDAFALPTRPRADRTELAASVAQGCRADDHEDETQRRRKRKRANRRSRVVCLPPDSAKRNASRPASSLVSAAEASARAWRFERSPCA